MSSKDSVQCHLKSNQFLFPVILLRPDLDLDLEEVAGSDHNHAERNVSQSRTDDILLLGTEWNLGRNRICVEVNMYYQMSGL